MEFTITFLQLFFWTVILVSPLLLFLVLLIVIFGQVAGRVEGWKGFDTIYWSFITAMTVGYGDICPTKLSSRVLSIVISFIGVILFGLVVAITVNTATKSFELHVDMNKLLEIQQGNLKNHP
jgi:voltage-gated potassium channel